jgi:hypothetical protein
MTALRSSWQHSPPGAPKIALTFVPNSLASDGDPIDNVIASPVERFERNNTD